MKFKGGYTLKLKGPPTKEVKELPEPEIVHLPLFSHRFDFSELCVQDGEEVKQGDVIAEDPNNYSIPLLAPRTGKVKADIERRHVTLENIQKTSDEAIDIGSDLPDVAKDRGDEGKDRYALVRLGAWQFVSDAFTGNLPDPYGVPQAVIVSTAHLEPFLACAEALLKNRVSNFEKGLEHVRSLANNQPVYVIIPKAKSETIDQVKGFAGKNSWITLVEVPAKYPFDNVKLCAQKLELDANPDKGAVWALGTEGVLAIDNALSSSKPCVSRIISIAGPGAKKAEHVHATIGYPLDKLLEPYRGNDLTRVINGGVLTGETMSKDQDGLDGECQGLTLVPEQDKREILAFAHPGFTKHAFSNTFLSKLRPPFQERYTTGIRGEHRPCITCCFCEEVCPSRLMPHLVHKYVDKNRLEEAERFGLNLCVQCGLCAHVCTSKIEIKQLLLEGQEKLLQEI